MYTRLRDIVRILETAREEEDIFTTARTVMFLQQVGYDEELTLQEKSQLQCSFKEVREGADIYEQHRGFLLVRYLLLIRYFLPKQYIPPFEKDVELIQEAYNVYSSLNSYKHMQNIVYACSKLNIPLLVPRADIRLLAMYSGSDPVH